MADARRVRAQPRGSREADSGSTADPRPWLVMLSGSPWRAAGHRTQSLAAELAAAGPDGYRVLFVDPPSNGPQWTARVRRIDEFLWQARVPSIGPLGRQLPFVNRLNRQVEGWLLRRWLAARPGPRLLWIDEDLAAPLIGRLGEDAMVYDAVDLDWTFTRRWNRAHLRRALETAVTKADLVLASSAALPDYLPVAAHDVTIVPNGCDPQFFRPTGPTAGWLAGLPRPRLVYLGAINTRAFDADLVASVAAAHPAWCFVLVGPSTPAGRAPLTGLRNVHLIDAVPFAEAASIIRGCDVGIVPYRTTGLVNYVHPKKCFEYLAVGKPVVATVLPALAGRHPQIRLADGAQDFAAAIEQALLYCNDPVERAERRASAEHNSWTHRGVQVRTLLADRWSA